MNRTIFAAALFTALVAASPAMAHPPVVARTPQPPAAAAPGRRVECPRHATATTAAPAGLSAVAQADPAARPGPSDQRSLYGAVSGPRRIRGPAPDIVHHASFYLGQPDNEDRELPQNRADSGVLRRRQLRDDRSFGFIAFFVTIGWLARLLVDHRRWLRAAKTQTDAQAKLFDRLTSNEDLLSYIQSPAGTRFLQPAPMPVEAGPRSGSQPRR